MHRLLQSVGQSPVIPRLDVEDRIADKADARLQRLRKVMSEMDKKARKRSPWPCAIVIHGHETAKWTNPIKLDRLGAPKTQRDHEILRMRYYIH